MKAAVFDFNGTLFLDHDKHVKAWSAISMDLRGRPITEEELHTQMNGIPNAQLLDWMTQRKLEPEESDRLSRLKEAYYRQFCLEDPENLHLIAGTEELFDWLKEKGVPFTIASASIQDNMDFFVKTFGLDKWIDPKNIVFDDGTYADKKEMFAKCCQILNTKMKDLTILEDSYAGIACALECGCQDVRVINSGHMDPKSLQDPGITQVCMDMTEIKR